MNYVNHAIPVYYPQQVSQSYAQPNIHILPQLERDMKNIFPTVNELQSRVLALETKILTLENNQMQQKPTFHHDQISQVPGTPTAIQQSCARVFHMNDIIHRHESLINHLVMYQEKDKTDEYSPYLQMKMQKARDYMIRSLMIMIEDLDGIDRLWGRTFQHCAEKYGRAEWRRMLSICIIALNTIKMENGNLDKNCDALIKKFTEELEK